ncbi:MAG TPA: heparinase II/III family protein [archaeon]|nr:heparinase II/III family protein [archaeon]
MKILRLLTAAFFALALTVNQAQAGERFGAGLLFSEEELPGIRANLESEVFADYWKSLLDADWQKEKAFLDTLRPGQYCVGIGRVGDILRREAFVYAVTGDKKRAARALEALDRLLEYPRWDVFYDYDGKTLGVDLATHATMSAAYAFDWLYPALDEKKRAALQKAIAEKGCEACFHTLGDLRYPEGKTDWRADHYDLDLSRWPYILDKTNIKGLMIGGLGLGALALLERDSRAARWLEMAEFSARRFLELYWPDGFYPEGSGYWEYSSTSVYPFLQALKRITGTDLSDLADLRGAAEGWLSIQMPYTGHSRGVVNFGDNGREIDSSPLFFIASTFRDGLAQWAGKKFCRYHDIHSPVFYDPGLAPQPPTENQSYRLLGRSWLTARTGFETDDIVVAMRSGGPFNHEHSDRNSFILKAFGEVLLFDIPHPSYNRRHPTWQLRHTKAHNCVLVDGRGMLYHDGSEGTNKSADSSFVVAEGRREGYFYWTSDATPAYALADPDVRSVVRTLVAALDVPCLVVLDKVEKFFYESSISALWQIDNSDSHGEAECLESGFLIRRPGASLFAQVAGSSPVDVSSGFHPVSGEETKYPFVQASCKTKEKGQLMITAMVPVPESAGKPEIEIKPLDKAGKRWQVKIKNSGKSFSLKVTDSGRVPGFEVVR